jgi:hypothetical protein
VGWKFPDEADAPFCDSRSKCARLSSNHPTPAVSKPKIVPSSISPFICCLYWARLAAIVGDHDVSKLSETSNSRDKALSERRQRVLDIDVGILTRRPARVTAALLLRLHHC